MYPLNREKRLNTFPRSTDKIQILNELPTDKRQIKVPQDSMLYPTYVNNKKILKIFVFEFAQQPSIKNATAFLPSIA